MDRRAFLQRLGPTATIGFLAGCTDGPDPGRVGQRTTTTGGVDFPDGPKERLTRPADLTPETVGDYVRQYEHAWVYNLLWTSEVTNIGVTCTVESVEQQPDGFRVTVACEGSSKTSGETPEGGTGTTTVVYGDYGLTRTIYLVDQDTTIRLDPDDVTTQQ